jgi:hypothetical protein
MLCEIERQRREEEYAKPGKQTFEFESGGKIQTEKLISLLKRMKAEKAYPKSGSQFIPAATFSSKTMVVKKVNKNE